REAFADRGYAADGTLVPRAEPGAVLADLRTVVQRCVRLATAGEVVAVDGTVLRVDPDSICLHGDTPGAVSLAHAVRSALMAAGVELAPFVRLR
ncbi:MAG TPA: LamB/YcsF family protein, partial [Actinomycetes bacterium]